MAYIYARAVHKGTKTLAEVPLRWRESTIEAYFDLYGEHIGG